VAMMTLSLITEYIIRLQRFYLDKREEVLFHRLIRNFDNFKKSFWICIIFSFFVKDKGNIAQFAPGMIGMAKPLMRLNEPVIKFKSLICF